MFEGKGRSATSHLYGERYSKQYMAKSLYDICALLDMKELRPIDYDAGARSDEIHRNAAILGEYLLKKVFYFHSYQGVW